LASNSLAAANSSAQTMSAAPHVGHTAGWPVPGARWHGPRLRELGKPTLVMCGDADPVLRPRASRDTAAAVPGARLVVLPGAWHVPPSAVWPTIAQQMRALADA
jgi:pimeloyl-ACP methyl ester carboxylesterase